jgi:hypothetical protein
MFGAQSPVTDFQYGAVLCLGLIKPPQSLQDAGKIPSASKGIGVFGA